MRDNNYLKLTKWGFIEYYTLVLLCLIIPAFTIYQLIEIWIGKYDGVRTEEELIRSAFPFLILAIFFAIYLRRKLRFIKIDVTCTDEEFQEALSRTRKEYDLGIPNNINGDVAAYWSEYLFRGGIMIRIIKEDDKIWFNAIPTPDTRMSVFHFRKCRKIRQSFILHLQQVLAGIPEKRIKQKKETEWSLKRIFIRMGMYVLLLILISLGIFIFFTSNAGAAPLFGLIIIALPLFYLYIDWKIILREKRKKNKKKRK